MNKALDILISKLIKAVLSNRWFKSLLSLIIVALAGLGATMAVTPTRTEPTVQTVKSQVVNVGSQAAKSGDKSFSLQGRVVRIADGDTFTLLVDGRQERIRMASIDAPETTKDRLRPGQPMAQSSKDALAKLIAGKTLTLLCFERDRYDRNVCDVPLAGGLTANQQQVASGMAWANMEKQGKFMRDAALPKLQQQAQQAKLGLWQDRNPVAPWVWRYQCWKQAQC